MSNVVASDFDCLKYIKILYIRASVRGSPGVDYPIYGAAAFTLSSFSCKDRVLGVYYADTGLGCQVVSLRILISNHSLIFLSRYFMCVILK